jgi:hypothetical protein
MEHVPAIFKSGRRGRVVETMEVTEDIELNVNRQHLAELGTSGGLESINRERPNGVRGS